MTTTTARRRQQTQDPGNPAIPVSALLPATRGSFLFSDLLLPECTHFDLSVEPFPTPPSLLAGLSRRSRFPERMASKFSYIMQTPFSLTRAPFFCLPVSLFSHPYLSLFLCLYISAVFRCKSRRLTLTRFTISELHFTTAIHCAHLRARFEAPLRLSQNGDLSYARIKFVGHQIDSS